ncbi:chitinase [Apiospora arundinis]
MSNLRSFRFFTQLPAELQLQVWEEAILADHVPRVVPLVRNTRQVVVTSELAATLSNRFFVICHASRQAAERVYDEELLVTNRVGRVGHIRVSTRHDIFFTSAWQLTLNIHIYGPASLFLITPSPLSRAALGRIRQVMEHHMSQMYSVTRVNPVFDRSVFSSVEVCYIRLEYQRMTVARIAALLGGPGPYTDVDLLRYYCRPCLYERRTLPEEDTEGESSGSD